MFARAGISSRVLRHGDSIAIGGFFGRPKKKTKPKQKFRCYVPFMWTTCVAICGGLAVLCGGTAMCVTGYYAKNFTTTEKTNGTHMWQETNYISYTVMWNMTYIGPVLMGFGCFSIVVACVVVCETRDKMLRIMEEDEKQGKKTKTKPDFYDLVIKKFRKDDRDLSRPSMTKQVSVVQGAVAGPSPGRRKSIFNFLLRRSSIKSVKSTKSEFAHIGGALRKIPMQIFAIDMNCTQKTSLLPISLTLGLDLGRKKMSIWGHDDYGDLCLVPKYPSTSCLHDLLKLNEEKLSLLFPDKFSWLEDAKRKRASQSHLSSQKPSISPRISHGDSQISYGDSRVSYGDSRDADDSDSDACNVTVHVQQTRRHVKSSHGSNHEQSELLKFPPAPDRRNRAIVNTSPLVNPKLLRANNNDSLLRSASETLDVPNNTIYCGTGLPGRRRGSLLRQKPVMEDGDSYPSSDNYPPSDISNDVCSDKPNNQQSNKSNNHPSGNNLPGGGSSNPPRGRPNNVPSGRPNNVPSGRSNNVPSGSPNNLYDHVKLSALSTSGEPCTLDAICDKPTLHDIDISNLTKGFKQPENRLTLSSVFPVFSSLGDESERVNRKHSPVRTAQTCDLTTNPNKSYNPSSLPTDLLFNDSSLGTDLLYPSHTDKGLSSSYNETNRLLECDSMRHSTATESLRGKTNTVHVETPSVGPLQDKTNSVSPCVESVRGKTNTAETPSVKSLRGKINNVTPSVESMESKGSVFIPYIPRTSSARVNSDMQRVRPLTRSLTRVDPSVFSKLTLPQSKQMTPFMRHGLTASSHFHYEHEHVPGGNQLRKCKTLEDFHEQTTT